jgi:VCBS repeat-containing protein
MSTLPGTQKEIRGTTGNDTIIGSPLDDLIRALGGSDYVDGRGGHDEIFGGLGNDTMFGDVGDDWLIGLEGDDVSNGGPGADQFRFYAYGITGAGTSNPGHDTDTIQDLTFAEGDLIHLSSFAAGTFRGTDVNGNLDILRSGTETNIRSWAGLIDLVDSSPAVTASRLGQTDTLLLEVVNSDGTIQTIAIEHGWSTYASLTNQPPAAAADTASVLEDATTNGNVLANDSDPNAGDAISVTAVKPAAGPGQAVPAGGSTTIDGSYGSITINADGSYSYSAANSAAQALSAGQVVQDVFTYTVTDGKGATSSAQLTIQVTGTNDAPVAQALTGTVSEDGPGIAFTPNFQDVDQNDTHSVTIGTAGTVGKVVLNGDGTFSYDADGKFESLGAGQSASDTFTYTVTDQNGGSSTASVTITIQGRNDDPVAKALSGQTSENGAAITFTPDFTDVDQGDTHVISVNTAGTIGAVTLNPNGTFSYNPDNKFEALRAGQTATDTFTYTVTDAAGASSTKTVTVTIIGENDAPVAQALTGIVLENGPALTLTPNYQDVDQGDTHTILVNTAGTKGKVVLNPDGTFSYDANGKFESLKAGQTATDTFTYTVKDGSGASSTQSVTITIQGQNDDPNAMGDFNGVVKNGKMAVNAAGGVLANDSDIDGNSLAVSGVNGLAAGQAVKGKYGTLTMASDGSYSYVANTSPGALPAKIVAQDHFAYTVSDGSGGFQTERLTVTVYDKGQTYMRGTDGNDRLAGGNGSDVLDGGNGSDVLIGGNGPDVLIGGRGNDILTGGSGPDTFVFNAKFGQDTITDFGAGDLIQFDKDVFADFASVLASASQSGSDVIINAGNGNSIILQNILLSNLHSSDFLFS